MNPAISDHNAASLAAEMFDHFCAATTMRQILGLYRNMCDILGLRPGPLNEFYPKFKAKVRNWKAQALWKKFDARASHRVYNKGTAANGTRVLVIGAGPCGLRTAIEAQLLGAKVVVVEKRDRISRNNVLHLWPFLITDLKALGAKKFYGKFCAGSIDHISIRQLQCILLKVALLLGVEVHEGVSFVRELEPKDGCGWRAAVSPEEHAVSHYEFDVLIGADGKRNTLEGFKRKEFRGKLAIAITANFINKKTEAEAKVEEISGVAFIFNQSFFKQLYQTTGIDLENIVYYKDETHYFVMTAKKHSLLDKGVIIQDYADPAELLSSGNVDTTKLLDYAREAANFSTKYQLPNLEFAVNHYGKPDVAMFDFTSMFAADNSCKVTVRKNYRLLSCLVGDSLLEPFWPTGSGCARGFLSSMDAAYAIKLFSNAKNSALAVLAQRESIYRLLAQTTPENLHRDIGAYTLDPSTRYPNLNKSSVNVIQIKHLLDTDDPSLLEQTFIDTNSLTTALGPEDTLVPKRKRRSANDTVPLGTVLLRWVKSQLKGNELAQDLQDPAQCFTSGRILCTLIARYRPDLVNLEELDGCGPEECNEYAFDIFENHLGIPRVMTGPESTSLAGVDPKQWLNYLEQICEVFRGEIPHVKHPKLDYAEFKQKQQIDSMEEFAKLRRFAVNRMAAMKEATQAAAPISTTGTGAAIRKYSQPVEEERVKRSRKVLGTESSPMASPQTDTTKRAKKRRSYEKFGNIDRDRGLAAPYPRSSAIAPDGEQMSDRIKSMEQRIGGKYAPSTEKKPKDLMRAIGKIDSNDWNVKEIEKKIELSRKATDIGKSRERVPKWNREQFLARQNKLTQKPDDEKYQEFDSTLKAVDKQLKEGHNLDLGERGKNKVASIAGQLLSSKHPQQQQVPQEQQQQPPKTTSKTALVLTASGVAEKCHFCKQRVYLMEKISAEGLTLHRSCLKCHHCHTNLRLGGYAFDRDDPEGKFYCTQHFKLPSKTIKTVPKKSLPRTPHTTDAKKPATAAAMAAAANKPTTPDSKSSSQFDLLDRGETPERIEFENIDEYISDGEAPMEVIDENEWTDRNFGSDSDASDDDDMSSSDESETDSESDYEEAAGSPLGAQTLQLASEWISDKRFSNMVDSDDDFYGYSSEDDEADSQTEGEELARAREIRMQEVKLKAPPTLPTDTETEVAHRQQQPPVVPSVSFNQLSTSSTPSANPILASSVPTVANPPTNQPPTESAEDKALKERMLQKLSIREQWLHSPSPSPSPAPSVDPFAPVPEVPKPKTSFFGGLMNSLSTLIKSDKQAAPKTPTQAQDSPLCQPTLPPIPPSPSPSVRKLSTSSPKPPPSPTPSIRKLKQHPDIPPSPTPSLRKNKPPEVVVPGSPTPSLRKHKKHHKTSSSPTPSTGSRDLSEEELRDHSSGRSTPRSLTRRSRPASTEIREETDDFLERIKNDQAALDKKMKKIEAKNFKSNMQSIMSAVDGPRIVGVKSEKDVSKFFTGAKPTTETKPKQLPNKDVSALQGVNLSKYFPNAPAPTSPVKAGGATPSSVSSVESSPMLGRKKNSEVDLLKYFGPGVNKSGPSTPSSVLSPSISRKNSVESPSPIRKPSPVGSPKPPVAPLPPKKNILAFQPIKKSKTEIAVPSAVIPVKNILATQPVARPNLSSPKLEPKKKGGSPPKKSNQPSPADSDEQLFESLLKESPKSAKRSKPKTPPKRRSPDLEEQIFESILKETNQVSKIPAQKTISAPKSPPKPKSPPRRRSPNLDEQLFEDLLGEVDDSFVENFEEIVGLPKRVSPKLAKKKSPPKKSPKGSPKHSPPATRKSKPAAPKMTIKRPAFKIEVPVHMQETLEEIYLASLSKLDTRSASSTSLNMLEPVQSMDPELGKVDETFEQLFRDTEQPINKNQPFQNSQQTKTQTNPTNTATTRKPTGGALPQEGKASSSQTKPSIKERTMEQSILPVEIKNVSSTSKKHSPPQTPISVRKATQQTTELEKQTAISTVKKLTTDLSKSTSNLERIGNSVKPTFEKKPNILGKAPVDRLGAIKAESMVTIPSSPEMNRKNLLQQRLASTVEPIPTKVTQHNVNGSSVSTTQLKAQNILEPIKTTEIQQVSKPIVQTPVLERKPQQPVSPKSQVDRLDAVKTASMSLPSTPEMTRKSLTQQKPSSIVTPITVKATQPIVNGSNTTTSAKVQNSSEPNKITSVGTPVLERKVPVDRLSAVKAESSQSLPSTPEMNRKNLATQRPSSIATPVPLKPATLPIVNGSSISASSTSLSKVQNAPEPSKIATPLLERKVQQQEVQTNVNGIQATVPSKVSAPATPIVQRKASQSVPLQATAAQRSTSVEVPSTKSKSTGTAPTPTESRKSAHQISAAEFSKLYPDIYQQIINEEPSVDTITTIVSAEDKPVSKQVSSVSRTTVDHKQSQSPYAGRKAIKDHEPFFTQKTHTQTGTQSTTTSIRKELTEVKPIEHNKAITGRTSTITSKQETVKSEISARTSPKTSKQDITQTIPARTSPNSKQETLQTAIPTRTSPINSKQENLSVAVDTTNESIADKCEKNPVSTQLNEAQKPLEPSRPSRSTERSRERSLSTDDICFQRLRVKHEAIFREQKKEETHFTEIVEVEEPPVVPEVVDSQPVEVPRTLSEFRSAMLRKPQRPEEVESEEGIPPVLKDTIAELAHEIMPGFDLDSLMDDIPVPVQRKKSSFQKMFNKLQRANTIAAPEGSSLKAVLEPENKTQVVSKVPAQESESPKVEEPNLMQINLERSVSIKEKYAKQNAHSPPKKVLSDQTNLDRKNSFKIQPSVKNSSQSETLERPVPPERKSPQKKLAKSLKEKDKDLIDQRSILSRESKPAPKAEELTFDDLFEGSDVTTEIVNLDDLLSSDDEVANINATPKTSLTSPNKVTNNVQKSSTAKVPSPKKTSPVKSKPESTSAVANVQNKSLSETEFKRTSKELTEKFMTDKDQPKNKSAIEKKNEPKTEVKKDPKSEIKKDPKTEAMFTVLTEPQTSIMDSLVKLTKSEKIDKQEQPLSESLPDLINMTKKQPIEQPAPIKILDHTEKLKQIINQVPQEIQVYTLHTEEDKSTVQPQPSTCGMTSDYAHILKDISSGLVGADLPTTTFYEPPPRQDVKPKSDFTVYKEILHEMEKEAPQEGLQPQRPIRRPKPIDRSLSPVRRPLKAFDNSICIDPRRARRSNSIENVSIEQVFVKQNDKVIDTFYVVPEKTHLMRRSKSYDRMDTVRESRISARQQKKSLDELREYGFDVERPSMASRNLVSPVLRNLNVEEEGEDVPSFRELNRTQKFRKRSAVVDTSKLDVEATKVDIDRESPIPRTTDFSKWEAILDRGVPQLTEVSHKKESIRDLERKIEELSIERKPKRKISNKAVVTIPKEYDPEEYVPRINRRGANDFRVPSPDLPKSYDPDDYIPRVQRGHHHEPEHPQDPYDYEMEVPVSNGARQNRAAAHEVQRPNYYEQDVPVSVARSQRNYESDDYPVGPSMRPKRVSGQEPPRVQPYYDQEMAASRPQRFATYEDVPISRVGGKYYPEPSRMDDLPVSHTLPRSKTTTHVPYSSVSTRSYDAPTRDITKTQYSRRVAADNSSIVNKSHRLHEKANRYIRSQVSKNDPNPYIREMLENDSDDDLPVTTSASHRIPHTSSSALTSSSSYHHPVSSYGTTGSAAMSRITAKAITQPSRMTHYTRHDVPSPSATGSGSRSYRHRGGESGNPRDNCAIS
ncbi:F-actin-monooxygenase Mical isoform X2 [Uranotaenia lowii]|uniref:F-actin-monooxygenase Mical isoform X2 n=1 Tax=Uranotaenia lowii TaxID=190385 RepID=UPI002479FCE1|nr:F-actin-monooxygenase Mical isoform X2 [Uranotaenia lowii]